MEFIKDDTKVYLYFVLRQHLCRVELDMSEAEYVKDPPPEIETLIRFRDRELPIGMGAFTIGSNVYLLGGEILKKDQNLHPDLQISSGCYCKRLSDRVFLCDPHKYPYPNIKQVSSMNGPKACPQVAIVDDKVYVLAGQQYANSRPPRSPMFECYHIREGRWEVLPDPPFYSKVYRTFFLFVSVHGREIIVNCQEGVWFYDVDTKIWSGDIDFENNMYGSLGGVVDKSDDGIIVVYREESVLAYLDYNLKHVQVLEELYVHLPIIQSTLHTAFITHIGENKFCLFLSETYHARTEEWKMVIILFRLEMLDEKSEEAFCRVIVFGRQTYIASKDITNEQFNPTHAFIVREGLEKHGLGYFRVGEGKDGLDRDMASMVDGVNGRALEKSNQSSKSAKRNRRRKERRAQAQRWWKLKQYEIACENGRRHFSLNPSKLIGVPKCSASSENSSISSGHQIDEEIKEEIQVVLQELRMDEEKIEIIERLYREKILLELEQEKTSREGGADSSTRETILDRVC